MIISIMSGAFARRIASKYPSTRFWTGRIGSLRVT